VADGTIEAGKLVRATEGYLRDGSPSGDEVRDFREFLGRHDWRCTVPPSQVPASHRFVVARVEVVAKVR
jgi:hypothetical protein